MTTIKVTKYYNDGGSPFIKVDKDSVTLRIFDVTDYEKAIEFARLVEDRIKYPLPPPEDILVINID